MAFTFKLDAVDVASLPIQRVRALAPLPLGATASGSKASPSKPSNRAWPWEAVPLLIHRILNNGQREETSMVARQAYDIDRVLRGTAWLIGVGVGTYILMYGVAFHIPIGSDDWYMWVVLGSFYLVHAVFLVASLWGRFRPLPADVTTKELADREELQLPALLWNFEVFGIDRAQGWLAAFVVTFLQLIFVGTWVPILYACAARMVANDPYEPTFTLVWIVAILMHLVTAVARSAGLSELRDFSSKMSQAPSPVESVRVTLMCLYIFLVVTLVLPLSVFAIVYVRF